MKLSSSIHSYLFFILILICQVTTADLWEDLQKKVFCGEQDISGLDDLK